MGSAYAPGTAIPGASTVYGFFCTAGGGRCNGLNVNHFATRATSYGDPLWQGPNEQAVFMSWYGRRYADLPHVERRLAPLLQDNGNPGGAAGSELLGCVW